MTFQFNPGIILTHLHLNSGTFSIASIFSLVIFFSHLVSENSPNIDRLA